MARAWLLLALFVLLPNHSPAAGNGFRGVRIQRDSYGVPHISAPTDAGEGSNMWALAPSRTAGGQRYEAHLHSKQGLRVSCFAILGTPYIRSGWTPTHGWSHTNNYADTVDVWREAPDAQFKTWHESLRIKSNGKVETVTLQLRKTARGPVIAFTSTAASSPNARPASIPPTLVPKADGPRARNSRRLLSAAQRVDFHQWSAMALDTSVYSAAEDLKRLPRHGPPELQPLPDELHNWNHVSTIDSVAMTLYTRWVRLKNQDPLAALAQVRAELAQLHGAWRVPCGSITRLQRTHTSGTREQFSKDKPSLPAAGGVGYGFSGNTHVAVVEFGKKPRARSLLVFGQSADPKSPHYVDQAPLYSEMRFKDVC